MSKPYKFKIDKDYDGAYRVLVLYSFSSWQQVAVVYDRKLANAIVKMVKGGESFKSMMR